MADALLTRGETRVILDMSLVEAATIRALLDHVAHGYNPLEVAFANVSTALDDALEINEFLTPPDDALGDVFNSVYVSISEGTDDEVEGCIRFADVDEDIAERLEEMYS